MLQLQSSSSVGVQCRLSLALYSYTADWLDWLLVCNVALGWKGWPRSSLQLSLYFFSCADSICNIHSVLQGTACITVSVRLLLYEVPHQQVMQSVC